MKFYEKAIDESVRNGIDKAKAQVALGEIYYSKENYLKAQPLYSEAMPVLPTTFENYTELNKKSLLLNDIAKNQQTIILEDSLQYLSTLSKEKQIAIIEEVIKKRKEEDKNKKDTPTVYYPLDDSLNQAFTDYVEMRKKIKKPMTERAKELAIKKLVGFARIPDTDVIDTDMAISILEQTATVTQLIPNNEVNN